MLLQMIYMENYLAIIDSIGCAGQTHGKPRISLVLSRFNLLSLSRDSGCISIQSNDLV